MVGKVIIYKKSCDSTNSYAKYLISMDFHKLLDGAVIITDNQFSGKGQHGNTWYSEPGKNLTFSIIIYPKFISLNKSYYLNLIATTSVYRVLQNFFDINCLKIKWPNDIMFDTDKICGILIENSVCTQAIYSSIVGIGVNVNQKKFVHERVTSLSLILKRDLPKNQILDKIILSFNDEYNALISDCDYIKSIKQFYLKNLYWAHEPHVFNDHIKNFVGIIVGIDNLGRLLVSSEYHKINKNSTGLKSYDIKQIVFVR